MIVLFRRTELQREINRLTRERITDEEINSFTEDELEVLAIYQGDDVGLCVFTANR